MYSLFKAIHIIGFVSWFAGLFYIGRLFIYIRESSLSSIENDRLIQHLNLMAKRVLYAILIPAACITFVFGMSLAVVSKAYLFPWFHLKFVFVLGLILYTWYCRRLYKQFLSRNFGHWTSFRLRVFNEVATLFPFSYHGVSSRLQASVF